MDTPTFPVLPDTLLIISLKLYFSPSRTLDYLRALLDPANDIVRPANRSRLLLALIPDFLCIYPCAEIIHSHESRLPHAPAASQLPPSFLLGAQDCFWESDGAFTGEVSPRSLRSVGASIVELGHAERRALFGETDEVTAKKARAACSQGLIPLVCIGEVTPPESTGGNAVGAAVAECTAQIRPVLDAIPAAAPVIFAYEPVWAIGKPAPAGVDHVAAVVGGIRDMIGRAAPDRPGHVRVLYGGSAGPGLWTDRGLGKAVDGMFLGRFAHEPDGVRKVVREVEAALGL